MSTLATVPWAALTISLAKLRTLEECACVRLAGKPGLALTPLWLPSPVIQLVAVDGVHVGRVRMDVEGAAVGWYAVPLGPERPRGPYATPYSAARVLMQGKYDARPQIRTKFPDGACGDTPTWLDETDGRHQS